MTGDLIEYEPGARVPVEVVANTNGNVAVRGQGVALSGENENYTEVGLVATAGSGVGILIEDPEDFTGSQGDYAAGDSAGVATMQLWMPVQLVPIAADWDPNATGTQTPAVGDEVMFGTGGTAIIYASADASSPYGVVFRTIGDPFATDKIAVAVQR